MNYIAEINSFYNWVMLNPISPDAQALWHALMQMNNQCAVKIGEQWYWRVEFTVPNMTLLSILAFSRQQLDRMRNVLIQTGRIVYKKGKGSQSGTYKIIPFDTSAVEFEYNSVRLWRTVSHNVTQLDTQPDTQLDTQTGHKADTNPNLCNIFGTLINSNNINNNYNKYAAVAKAYESMIGVVTKRVIEVFDSYDISDELKIRAISEAHDNNAGNIKYIEAILQRYERDGIKSVADAERRSAEYKRRKKGKGGKGSSPPSSSYDFDEIEALELKKRMGG